MSDTLTGLLFIGAWILLQQVILPRFGVPT
jgi:hypothetical protein